MGLPAIEGCTRSTDRPNVLNMDSVHNASQLLTHDAGPAACVEPSDMHARWSAINKAHAISLRGARYQVQTQRRLRASPPSAMRVLLVPLLSDNYGYILVSSDGMTAAVDPVEPGKVRSGSTGALRSVPGPVRVQSKPESACITYQGLEATCLQVLAAAEREGLAPPSTILTTHHHW